MANKLPPLPVGVAPGSGYWNDWYEKLRTLINSFAAGFPFSSITSLPTTLSGYGITDGVANGRTISTTAPLTGGGDLSANRTFAITEFAGSSPGSVPTSLGGTTNFLRADGTWSAPSGGGGSSLTQVTGTDANVTMAVNSLYVLDGSILTADRTYTLPATAAVGDEVVISLTASNSTYELIVTAAAGDTLNGVAGGTEWSRLFLLGETIFMRCVVANTTWLVIQDGRVAQVGEMSLTADCDGEAANTTTLPTSAATPGTWTVNAQIGISATTGTGRLTVRRGGKYLITVGMRAKDSPGASALVTVAAQKNGTTIRSGTNTCTASLTGGAVTQTVSIASADDYFQMAYSTSSGGLGCRGAAALTFLIVSEVLS